MNCFDYYSLFKNDKLCFVYNGAFNDNITDKVLQLTEQNVNQFDELTKLRRKVSFLMVECFQNVVRHGEANPVPSEPKGCFATRYDGTTNFISAVNLINSKGIPDLQRLLQQINNMSTENLRELYKKVLVEPIRSGRGAGLGLIEMARKSGQPLTFDFDDDHDDFANFYLAIKLKGKSVSKASSEPLCVNKDFYKGLDNNNINLIYKGDFSEETIYPITFIAKSEVERNYKTSSGKKIFHALIDVVQNIPKHVKNDQSNEGILIITEGKEGRTISAGNEVSHETMRELAVQYEFVASLTSSELEDEYLRNLAKGSEDESTMLSVLSLARKGKTTFKHSFTPMSNGRFFFNISVTL